MICILKMRTYPLHQTADSVIAGWIIATTMADARHQAQAAGEHALATLLYRTEFMPPPGRYTLGVPPDGQHQYVALVS